MEKMLAILPSDVIARFKYDAEATWSFTDLKIGMDLAKRMIALPGITANSRVLDATASVGGNTIAFASQFHHVSAVELDRGRKSMLDENIELVGIGHIVHATYCDYAQTVIAQTDFDIVFFDPPWGTDYKSHNKIRIVLSGPEHSDTFESVVAAAARKCKYVVLKLPQNYDLEYLEAAVPMLECIHKEWHGRPNTMLIMILRRK